MTCIVGVETKDQAILMGDSSATDGWTMRATGLQKVFTAGHYVIGYTTSFRMGQILQYCIDYPKCNDPTLDFMCREFIPAVRAAFKEQGYLQIESSQESGGQFLIACLGKIFKIDSDFQVNQYQDGLYAIGAGAEYALGAMYVSDGQINRAQMGLEAAERFSTRVCGPFIGPIISRRSE